MEGLGALVPAALLVKRLELTVSPECCAPGDAVRAGPALARLRDLRQLTLRLQDGTPACAARLLPAAFPAPTALSMLTLDLMFCDEAQPLLGPCTESLRRLEIMCKSLDQLQSILESAPSLASITWLRLW